MFLDRDGVLNPTVLNPATARMESPLAPEDFHLGEGVANALRRLQNAGYGLILVSNQPNYALGKSSFETLSEIHAKLVLELASAGIEFRRFCYCFHHPQGVTPSYSKICECRKPSPWFLLEARDDFGLSLSDSWMVGDQPTDTQCGRAAGVRTIRIGPPPSGPTPGIIVDPNADFRAAHLADAAEMILASRLAD